MEDQTSTNDNIQFNLSVSTDRDDFLRRACPSCGRDFKTEIDAADLAWVLNSQIRRVSLEIGVEPSEMAKQDTQDNLHCPYCQHVTEASEMHTEETVEYLKRFAYREYALPLINRMFSELEESLGGGSRGGGDFFSISISFTHERSLLPPRPIHGPEPADMKIVDLLCCRKKIKIADKWTDVSICPYCGTQVTLI